MPRRFCKKTAVPRIVNEARFFILGYALILCVSIFVGSAVLFWIWIFPLFLGQPFLRFYLLAEHGLCPKVTNIFENTRTTLTNRDVRFVAWNIPYHTERHTYPTVPFHKLPDLHEIIQREPIHKGSSYTAITSTYIAKLKVK